MRPVADLARRRLSDRLPLDPTAAVTEFAAHAAQRRDMYFAAQTARRLNEMEGLRLRVPEVYRHYSSARCVTFEAPADRAPLEGGEYRDVSRELVRLALAEGVYLADLAPERFAADGSDIWLADPTETLALDPERLRGVAEVLAAVRRGDVDGVARVLPLAGGLVPRDDSDLRRELRETMGALGGSLWREHSLEEVRDRGLEAVRRGGARLHVEVAQMMRSMIEAEGLGAERRTEIEAAADAAEVLISRHRDPAYIAARTVRRLAQPDTFADYPRQLHALLNELKDGEVEVRFRHAGLDELISKVDILANRLVFAFLIAALIIGSSMLGIFLKQGSKFLGVSIFGLAGFVFAAVLGLLLLIGIIRSGRL
jgi:ubiquinone biosynthesis protein